MKYFVSRQQGIDNPFVHLHNNSEYFILLTATSTPTTIKTERIVAFAWQKY